MINEPLPGNENGPDWLKKAVKDIASGKLPAIGKDGEPLKAAARPATKIKRFDVSDFIEMIRLIKALVPPPKPSFFERQWAAFAPFAKWATVEAGFFLAPFLKHMSIASAKAFVAYFKPAVPTLKTVPWTMNFELEGKKGQVLEVSEQALYLFKPCRLSATDSFDGCGTKVVGMLNGQRLVLPMLGKGTLTSALTLNAFDQAFESVQLGIPVMFRVEFLQDCTWNATLFGRAVEG